MTLEEIRSMLAWCAVINIGLLLIWWVMFVLLHNWMYRMHRTWFKLSEEQFDRTHYAGMAFTKVAVLIFNVAPYLALRIIG